MPSTLPGESSQQVGDAGVERVLVGPVPDGGQTCSSTFWLQACSRLSLLVPHRAKIISTELALRTTLYLKRERDYMPWESAINNLDFFYLMFDRSEVYGPLQVLERAFRGSSQGLAMSPMPGPSCLLFRFISGSRSDLCLSTTPSPPQTFQRFQRATWTSE